ncbi:MAG: chalcone isomerase family protein [Rhodoferax sp.]
MKLIVVCALLVWATATFGLRLAVAQSAPPTVLLPGAQLAGEGTLRFLGFVIYQARLWVRPGFEPEDYAAHPLALELIYHRGFTAQEIAQRSITEMRRVGTFTPQQAMRWQQALQAALPDVKPGDRLVGLYRPGEGVVFERDGRPTGEVKDPNFSRLFFGIWLSPQTSEPGLRQALMAGRKAGQP